MAQFGRLILIFLVMNLASCHTTNEPPLKISINSWLGYSPLYYAEKNGLLNDLNVKLLHVVSLAESRQLYDSGIAQAYAGTQYEFSQSWENDRTTMPIMMFDRSDGGDLIFSNRSPDELKASIGTIHAYLEIDSVNQVLLKDFLEQNNLNGKNIIFHDMDQAEISTLKNLPDLPPVLIVTYIPYNFKLEEQGFHMIATTKNSNLLVIDALFTSQHIFQQHKPQFIALKKILDDVIKISKKDPELYYEQVKSFLGEPGLENFLDTLDDIKWLNKTIKPDIKDRLIRKGFPVRDIIQ